MKRTLATLIMAFGLGSLYLPAPAFAQNNPAVAEVPFAFVISGETLPAGTYNVSEFKPGTGLFTVRGDHQSQFASLGAREEGHPTNPSLTFAQIQGQWTLVKVTPPNSTVAYSLGHEYQPRHMNVAAMISVKLK